MRISDWSSDVCSSDLSRIPRSGSDVHEVDRDYCLRSISVPFRVRSEAQQVDDRVVGREAAELLRRGQNKHGAYEARMPRSEEHTSDLQSLMRISYAVFCFKKKNTINIKYTIT